MHGQHRSIRGRGTAALAAVPLSLILATPILAQLSLAEIVSKTDAEDQAKGPVNVATNAPIDEYGRGVPRTAVQTYLRAARKRDYERAAKVLDLRRFSKANAKAMGPEIARHLSVVLDARLWIDTELLSDQPEGFTKDGLPANQDRVGRIELSGGNVVDILLQRVPGEDGVRVWKFAATTVAQIPALYGEFGDGPLVELFPRFLLDYKILDISAVEWITAVLIGLIAFFGAFFVTGLAGWIFRRSGTPLAVALANFLTGPLRLLLAVTIFVAIREPLGFSIVAKALMVAIERSAVQLAGAWVGLRMVDVLGHALFRRLVASGQSSALHLLPHGRKLAKSLVIVVAAIGMLSSFGFNVTALLAGLGVGGIAVALAAQKTIENLIGGVTLYADEPVRVGDFCRFGDKVGTVEGVGMRSTRVRTLDRTVVSIPNAEFANLQLDNFSRRDKIWYHPRISLRYETTPDQLRFVLVELRKLLYAHPKVDPDPARVRFVGFGDSSLDLDIFAYVNVTEYSDFLEVAEDLNLRIMDLVAEAGTSIAFPSQTTYIENGQAPSEDRARQIGETVQQWRQRGELYLPRFPNDKIDDLRGTLDYPPKGSPMAA